MEFTTSEGYLLLADISGYTAFLTGTELDHAHGIIRELTSLVRRELAPPLRFVKLEGDAVFCHADGATFRDGERFVELVEACYFAFANRLDDIARSTTCRCRACAAVGSLDLKFLAHYGTYIVDEDEGREDLTGPDVILVHRLLKNTVGDGGPASAYALFTDALTTRLPTEFTLPAHTEFYEGLGEATGFVHDLRPVLAAMREGRSERLTTGDADFEMVAEFPAVPAVVWQYFVDPVERQRWVCREFSEEPDVVTRNTDGRVGVGATSHCNHAPGTWFRQFLAWSPFEHFSCRTVAPGPGPPEGRSALESAELLATPEGTRVTVRTRLVDRGAVEALEVLVPAWEAGWRESHDTLRGLIVADAVTQ